MQIQAAKILDLERFVVAQAVFFLGLNDDNNTDMEGEKSHQKCEGPGENS